VRAHLPELVLLDVSMPEMAGYELCRRLKADPHSRDLPVFFINAHREAADKPKAFAAGGVDYVTKLFRVCEVLARIQTHLYLHRQHQHLVRTNAELERKAAPRNPNGAGHSTRTTKLAQANAGEFGLDADRIEGLGTAALLADLGIAGVRESILLKPEALTPAEITLIRTHPQLGADLAQPLALPCGSVYPPAPRASRRLGLPPEGLKG